MNTFGVPDAVVDTLLLGILCMGIGVLVAGAAVYVDDRLYPSTALYLAIGLVIVTPTVMVLGGFAEPVSIQSLSFDPSAATFEAVRIGAIVTGVLVGLVWLRLLFASIIDIVTGDDPSVDGESVATSVVVPLFIAPGVFLLAGVPIALVVRFRVIAPLVALLPVCYVAFYPAFGETPSEGNPAVLFGFTLIGSPLIAVGYGLVTAVELAIRFAIHRLVDAALLVGAFGAG